MTTIPADQVEALELAADAIEYAARAQLADADPSHEQWYPLHSALVRSIGNLSELATVLARQMPRYGDQRVLRADNDEDPAELITSAGELAGQLRHALDGAYRIANQSWSAIGHVGVAVDPNAEAETPS